MTTYHLQTPSDLSSPIPQPLAYDMAAEYYQTTGIKPLVLALKDYEDHGEFVTYELLGKRVRASVNANQE